MYSFLQAILLKQNLIVLSQFVIDQQSEVINELCDKIKEAQKQTKKGIKAQKVSSEYCIIAVCGAVLTCVTQY